MHQKRHPAYFRDWKVAAPLKRATRRYHGCGRRSAEFPRLEGCGPIEALIETDSAVVEQAWSNISATGRLRPH